METLGQRMKQHVDEQMEDLLMLQAARRPHFSREVLHSGWSSISKGESTDFLSEHVVNE